jgi:hypothetical protein
VYTDDVGGVGAGVTAAAGIVVWANIPTVTTAVARTNHAFRFVWGRDPVVLCNLLIVVNAASSKMNVLIWPRRRISGG